MQRIRHYLLVATTVLGLAACIAAPVETTSPLAIWAPDEAEGFEDSTVGNGQLVITAECVELVLDNDKRVLLVWPEPTTWDASAQVIKFVGLQGEQIELRDGDQIMPGGSPAVGTPRFVKPPEPACKADETFIVNSVRIVTE